MGPKERAKGNGLGPAAAWRRCREGAVPAPTPKEALASFCARLCGRRPASRRAEAAVKAAESDG